MAIHLEMVGCQLDDLHQIITYKKWLEITISIQVKLVNFGVPGLQVTYYVYTHQWFPRFVSNSTNLENMSKNGSTISISCGCLFRFGEETQGSLKLHYRWWFHSQVELLISS